MLEQNLHKHHVNNAETPTSRTHRRTHIHARTHTTQTPTRTQNTQTKHTERASGCFPLSQDFVFVDVEQMHIIAAQSKALEISTEETSKQHRKTTRRSNRNELIMVQSVAKKVRLSTSKQIEFPTKLEQDSTRSNELWRQSKHNNTNTNKHKQNQIHINART